MTTLFSIFAPIFFILKLKSAMLMLILVSILFWYGFMLQFFLVNKNLFSGLSLNLFNLNSSSVILLSIFTSLASLNLMSFMLYSYPVTTTLSFNLSAALGCWLVSVLLFFVKSYSLSAFLPMNTPWYLVPFLCIVELISIIVRPMTLCFRLLANMVAGHVLLALLAKISYFWVIGSLFGTLEIMVAIVQAFVFSMLVSVYLDEVFSH